MNNDAYSQSYDDNDPQIQVRTDLWHTMNMSDLVHQRDLLMSHMEKASRMIGFNASPAVLGIYSAMQMALQDINHLIDATSDRK